MDIDSWILMDKVALDIAWDLAHPTDGSPIPDNVKILNQGVRGFWKDIGSDECVNTLATQAELDQFQIDHAADVNIIYGWVQGPGYDNLDAFETVPQGVLDLMKDHIEYDSGGNTIGSTPAAFANPNWAHLFLGQSERIFAGAVTNGFNGGFL